MAEDKLPPLPPSDPGSLERNHYDHFYKRSSREFWKENEIIYIKNEESQLCGHYFERKERSLICRKCHIGYVESVGMTVVNGQLYYKNEEIKFKDSQ